MKHWININRKKGMIIVAGSRNKEYKFFNRYDEVKFENGFELEVMFSLDEYEVIFVHYNYKDIVLVN